MAAEDIYIYRVTEYEWVAARSLTEACEFYTKETGEPTDEEYQVNDVDLDTKRVWDNDDEFGPKLSWTYREHLANKLAQGLLPPFWFCFVEP